jgi:hypothetical protein
MRSLLCLILQICKVGAGGFREFELHPSHLLVLVLLVGWLVKSICHSNNERVRIGLLI